MGYIVRVVMIILFGFWSTCASAKSPPPTKGPADLYVLSVGVGRYADRDFSKFDAGRYSAELVSRSLLKAGARYALTLTDEAGQNSYITRDDVLDALRSLKRKIREDRPRAPRILVYLLMHGVADATSNYLFMVPGNLVIEPNPVPQEDVFRLAKATVWNFDLLTSLMTFRMDKRLNHFDDFV